MFAAVGLLAAASVAQAETINFSTYADTYLSSADGVSFSLAGGYAVNGYGPAPYTTPYVNAFGDANEIANSGNFGEYPTSNTLTFKFVGEVASGVSFYFDNYGGSTSGRGATFYDAYGPGGALISSGFIGTCCESSSTLVTVAGSGIQTLVLNNNTGDPTGSNSWLFGVDSLTFTPSPVPLPSTWTMLLIGLAGLGFVAYRPRKQTPALAA